MAPRLAGLFFFGLSVQPSSADGLYSWMSRAAVGFRPRFGLAASSIAMGGSATAFFLGRPRGLAGDFSATGSSSISLASLVDFFGDALAGDDFFAGDDLAGDFFAAFAAATLAGDALVAAFAAGSLAEDGFAASFVFFAGATFSTTLVTAATALAATFFADGVVFLVERRGVDSGVSVTLAFVAFFGVVGLVLAMLENEYYENLRS